MAIVRTTGITFNTTAGDKTVTVTVQPGELAFVVCACTGLTTTPTITDNNNSGTYTQINTGALKNASADKMWIFARNDYFINGSSTIFTFDDAGTDTGGGLCAILVKGVGGVGSSAALQSAKQENQAASGTPAPVFGSTPSINSLIIGAVFNGTNPAGMTPRTNYTEQRDNGYGTPATGLEVMTRNEGETSATITWGGTSASAFASMVIEVNSPLFPSFNNYRSVKCTSGNTGIISLNERIR